MACDCKVNKQIIKLHKEYGKKINLPWKEKIGFRLEEGLKFIVLSLLIIIFLPIIFVYFFIRIITGNGYFNVNKMLRFILRKDE